MILRQQRRFGLIQDPPDDQDGIDAEQHSLASRYRPDHQLIIHQPRFDRVALITCFSYGSPALNASISGSDWKCANTLLEVAGLRTTTRRPKATPDRSSFQDPYRC